MSRTLPPLASTHQGMRVCAKHMLEVGTAGKCQNRKGYAYQASVMMGHLQGMADRYYAGDVAAVDEFCQLYCFDQNRPKEPPLTFANNVIKRAKTIAAKALATPGAGGKEEAK